MRDIRIFKNTPANERLAVVFLKLRLCEQGANIMRYHLTSACEETLQCSVVDGTESRTLLDHV